MRAGRRTWWRRESPMNPRYALFVWSSYALTLAVVLWNAWVPQLRRRQLKRQLSDALDDPAEAGSEQAS